MPGRPCMNLRIETVVPLRAIGAMTMWIREPSGRRASRRGRSSLRTRPTNWAMLRAAPLSPSTVNLASVRMTLPLASIQISSGPLIMISETEGSSRYLRTGLRNARRDSWYIEACDMRRRIASKSGRASLGPAPGDWPLSRTPGREKPWANKRALVQSRPEEVSRNPSSEDRSARAPRQARRRPKSRALRLRTAPGIAGTQAIGRRLGGAHGNAPVDESADARAIPAAGTKGGPSESCCRAANLAVSSSG